ncbi:MAG: hypothetical protein LBC97_00530 [Bifidobacteriaceae bacterium]|jgi:hypothetical protein|nr:hypothetical protein [Bifidobacteriaceae bacterium]
MAQGLTEEQIDQALLFADAVLAAAGHAYHDPEHDQDLREAGRGRMTIDEVVRRGIERIRDRG